jgi:hypothetical protein
MTQKAVLGFKLHTGWAVLVAVAGDPDEIQVLHRQRVELMPHDSPIPRFVYHAASEIPMNRATLFVERGRKASVEAASLAVKGVLEELNSRGIGIDVCGVLSGSTIVPDDLGAILRSHPMIHSAEGALFQNAIVAACEERGLRVVMSRERQIWIGAAAAWNITESDLRKNVDGLRKSLGPPWSADHKSATAIALLALRSNKSAKTVNEMGMHRMPRATLRRSGM